jgi:hypothetical protein
MVQMKQMTFRLSAIQRAQLVKLAEKLQIDQANVVRLAVAQLADREGIVISKRK